MNCLSAIGRTVVLASAATLAVSASPALACSVCGAGTHSSAKAFPGGWLLARAQLALATALNGVQTIGPVVTVGMRYEFE
jgi:hypothetical protein